MNIAKMVAVATNSCVSTHITTHSVAVKLRTAIAAIRRHCVPTRHQYPLPRPAAAKSCCRRAGTQWKSLRIFFSANLRNFTYVVLADGYTNGWDVVCVLWQTSFRHQYPLPRPAAAKSCCRRAGSAVVSLQWPYVTLLRQSVSLCVC